MKFALLHTVERDHIRRVLIAAEWNLPLAARLLGVHVRTVQRMVRRHRFRPPRWLAKVMAQR